MGWCLWVLTLKKSLWMFSYQRNDSNIFSGYIRKTMLLSLRCGFTETELSCATCFQLLSALFVAYMHQLHGAQPNSLSFLLVPSVVRGVSPQLVSMASIVARRTIYAICSAHAVIVWFLHSREVLFSMKFQRNIPNTSPSWKPKCKLPPTLRQLTAEVWTVCIVLVSDVLPHFVNTPYSISFF